MHHAQAPRRQAQALSQASCLVPTARLRTSRRANFSMSYSTPGTGATSTRSSRSSTRRRGRGRSRYAIDVLTPQMCGLTLRFEVLQTHWGWRDLDGRSAIRTRSAQTQARRTSGRVQRDHLGVGACGRGLGACGDRPRSGSRSHSRAAGRSPRLFDHAAGSTAGDERPRHGAAVAGDPAVGADHHGHAGHRSANRGGRADRAHQVHEAAPRPRTRPPRPRGR